MKIIHELLKDCEQHNLHEHKETLLNIVESVLYIDALPSQARGQVDDLWAEVKIEIEELQTPPTEEQIGLLHPNFDV